MSGEIERPMAKDKTQKTFLLNNDLLRIVEAWERRTGASFTRQVTAALAQYFFTETGEPSRNWTSWAGNLEKGECTLADIPLAYACTELNRASFVLKGLKRATSESARRRIAEFEAEVRRFKRMKDFWEAVRADGNDPVEGVVRFFQQGSPPARWLEEGDVFGE